MMGKKAEVSPIDSDFKLRDWWIRRSGSNQCRGRILLCVIHARHSRSKWFSGPSPEPVEDTQMVLLLGEAQIGVPIHSQSQVFEFADAEPECDTKWPCQPALSTNY